MITLQYIRSIHVFTLFNGCGDAFIYLLEPQFSTLLFFVSICFCLGMAVARDLLGNKNSVISVIGDGAMTAGQAYEAMNNAGFLDTNLIVVLNDNKQVSLPTATLDGPATPVGALSRTLSKIQASIEFRKIRDTAKVSPLNLYFLAKV